jgi:hypothetical protein
MITPMMSTGDPFHLWGRPCSAALPERSPRGRRLKPTRGSIAWLRFADHF